MDRRLYILVVVLFAALTGCVKQPMPGLPEDAPVMSINVKSGADDPDFTFLFWNEADFNAGLAGKTPYHVAGPDQEIGAYESEKYNTGRVYPKNYGVAICTGYAPYNGLVANSDYTELSVYDPGNTDVLVSRNFLEGSSLSPFSGALEFFHPQIQLTVKAKLAGSMAKYIKDVSFSVGPENLMSSLLWNDSEKKYLPSTNRGASSWTSAVLNEQLNKSDSKPLGTVLVIPEPSETEMTSIDIAVSGRIANTGSEAGTHFTMGLTAGLGSSLALGDSYEILLLFDEDQIEITASKVPWQEGGNVLVPVHPIPEPGGSGV
jgi:hypothetical protein